MEMLLGQLQRADPNGLVLGPFFINPSGSVNGQWFVPVRTFLATAPNGPILLIRPCLFFFSNRFHPNWINNIVIQSNQINYSLNSSTTKLIKNVATRTLGSQNKATYAGPNIFEVVCELSYHASFDETRSTMQMFSIQTAVQSSPCKTVDRKSVV